MLNMMLTEIAKMRGGKVVGGEVERWRRWVFDAKELRWSFDEVGVRTRVAVER